MSSNDQSSAAGLAARTSVIFGLYCLVDYLRIHLFLNWFMLFFVGLGILSTLNALIRDWWRGRLLKKAATPTGLYGSTEAIGLKHLLKAGLKTSNPDGNGIPLGAYGKNLLFYDGASHISIRAATGAGKTESSVVPICLALGTHRNIVATGKDKEVVEFVSDYRASIGQEVVIIDIGGKMKGTKYKTYDFNVCGHLPELAENNDPALFDQARKIAKARLTAPKNAGDNIFFTKQGRKWLKDILAGCAIWEAERGELVCNLPYVFSKLNSDDEELRAFLIQLSTLNHFDGTISGGIKRILSKWQSSAKTFDSVLSEIENGLEIFDSAGHIGQTSKYSDFDPRDIKRKPMTILLVTDSTKPDTQGSVAGLYLDTITNFALEADSFKPRLTIIADEFANLSEKNYLRLFLHFTPVDPKVCS